MDPFAITPISWSDCDTLAPGDVACDVLDALRAAGAAPQDWRAIDPVATQELLELDRYAATRTYVTALALSLAEAIGEEPKLNAPGCSKYSFDEAWLLRLLERSEAQDAESMAFLISSRVPHRYRNSIAFLVNGLVTRFEGRVSCPPCSPPGSDTGNGGDTR